MPELTPKMLQAALLMAQGVSIKDTAELVKVNEKTIDTWKRKRPEFNLEIKNCAREIYTRGVQEAVNKVQEATEYFAFVMRSQDESTVNRMRAAKHLVDIAGIAIAQDLEERVRALEEGIVE